MIAKKKQRFVKKTNKNSSSHSRENKFCLKKLKLLTTVYMNQFGNIFWLTKRHVLFMFMFCWNRHSAVFLIDVQYHAGTIKIRFSLWRKVLLVSICLVVFNMQKSIFGDNKQCCLYIAMLSQVSNCRISEHQLNRNDPSQLYLEMKYSLIRFTN